MGCDADLKIGNEDSSQQPPLIRPGPVKVADTERSGKRKRNWDNLPATERNRCPFPAAEVLWDSIPT
jgi:hypothetical protein